MGGFLQPHDMSLTIEKCPLRMLRCGSRLNTTNTGEGVKKSKKIVFFVPSFSSIEATAPLGLLAISTPLLQAGYEVRIIDATITADYQQRILDEVKDALCLGISVVTGPMIKDTVEAAKAVKKWNPEFPGYPRGLAPFAASHSDARSGIRRYYRAGAGRGKHP